MQNFYYIITFGVSFFLMTGCSSFEPRTEVVALKGAEVLSQSPSRSEIIVKNQETNEIFCLGRGADTGFQETRTIDLDLHIASIASSSQEEKGEEKEASGESELSGRTPGVLQAREVYYRTCEFIHNNKIPLEKRIDLFRETRKIVSDAWLKEIEYFSSDQGNLEQFQIPSNGAG